MMVSAVAVCLAVGVGAAAEGEGEAALPYPTFQSAIGAFMGSGDQVFFAESDLRLPLLRVNRGMLSYQHHEFTAFLDWDGKNKAIQGDWLYVRERFQAEFELAEELAMLAVVGYSAAYAEDRAGQLSAYPLGLGFGSPVDPRYERRIQWRMLAGGYLSPQHIDVNWWTDVSVAWRVVTFSEGDYMLSHYRASLLLAANMESANDDDRFRGLYRAGPELQLTAGNGNQAKLKLQWYHNDRNPFYGSDANNMLASVEVSTALDGAGVVAIPQERAAGWLPMVYGNYDVGVGSSRLVQCTDLHVEVVDFRIYEQMFTGVAWYESRQEQRSGDFDNMAYSVAVGLQTTVGLASVLSHGDPLVAGVDYLHRSDHSLNPDPARVAAVGIPTPDGPIIKNSSLDILPRLRLQTLGWDLPYRDPGIYERKTEWLTCFDWLATLGYTFGTNRDRGPVSGQLGLNCDVATVKGYVVYALGIGSIGNETPDWLGEVGVRRPRGAVFARMEKYGMRHDVTRGDTLIAGVRFSM